MKIYASRKRRSPLDALVGKDAWVYAQVDSIASKPFMWMRLLEDYGSCYKVNKAASWMFEEDPDTDTPPHILNTDISLSYTFEDTIIISKDSIHPVTPLEILTTEELFYGEDLSDIEHMQDLHSQTSDLTLEYYEGGDVWVKCILCQRDGYSNETIWARIINTTDTDYIINLVSCDICSPGGGIQYIDEAWDRNRILKDTRTIAKNRLAPIIPIETISTADLFPNVKSEDDLLRRIRDAGEWVTVYVDKKPYIASILSYDENTITLKKITWSVVFRGHHAYTQQDVENMLNPEPETVQMSDFELKHPIDGFDDYDDLFKYLCSEEM